MKRKLANYLAFWSNMTISSFFIHLMLVGAAMVAILIIGKINNTYKVPAVTAVLYFIGFLFVHGTFVGIASIFLLSRKEWGWTHWELIRIEDGRMFEVDDKAIPYTGQRYFIEKPNKYNDGHSEAKFNTWLSARHRNSKITIPVVIKFKMKSNFDIPEIFSVLYNAQGSGPLELHKYVIDYFMKINAENMPRINELIIDYANSKISEPDVLNSVIDLLTFPERPFFGVESVLINLSPPEITVCKGRGCEDQ